MAKVRVLSVQDVRLSLLKSEPPQLLVSATGITATAGWAGADLVSLEKVLSADGILDLEFVADPPKAGSLVPQVLTPISAVVTIEKDVPKIVGVNVHSRTNEILRLLQHEVGQPTTRAIGEEGVDPGQQFTTLALGEENPTTQALGEENPTTLALGEEDPTTLVWPPEEGGGGPTTMALGEENPTTLAWPPEEGGGGPTTMALGEENPTTLAWPPEEGGGGPTTMALGEENPTTLAWPPEEGGGGPTTLAFGEEKAPFAETSPTFDDPKPPFGEFNPLDFGRRNPFGRR